MKFLWLILIVPGVICFYALVVRTILHKIPALQVFYANADTFWAKVWAVCGNSLTIAWMHIVGGIGMLLELLDPIAVFLGDSDFKAQVGNLLKMDPTVLGYVMIGISVVTVGARMRSLSKGA